jgi:hypothetical protein
MKNCLYSLRFQLFFGLLAFISTSTKGQIESTTLQDFNKFSRTPLFVEEFNNQDILFEEPKLFGPTGDLMVISGEAKISSKDHGDGMLLVAKTTHGILDRESIEFEMRFKMNVVRNKWRMIFDVGQKNRYQASLRIDMNEGRLVCIHKTSIGVVEFKEALKDIYIPNEYNKLNLIRINNRVLVFLNNKLVGQSKYGEKKYTYSEKNIIPNRFDFRAKLVQPNGAIDYIKVSELSEGPVSLSSNNVPSSPQIKNTDTPTKVEPQRDSGFNFSTSVNTNEKTENVSVDIPVSGKYYAIIIGNNEYNDANISTLDQPIKDATKLYNVLTKEYTFEEKDVLFLKNATRTNIIEAFDALSNNLKAEDNLLIFYAGHGYWNTKKETGYWLPVDAKKSNTANWLRNSTIQGYLDEIPSKHTLLIADACFGGGIFKTRKAFDDAPPSIESLYKLKSRKGITSGMLNEVPDRSVFMEYLTKRLMDNNKKYTSSLDVFTQFRIAVMNNSNNTPQYGTIHNTGDEGGDFIFIKRKK